ncbi:MAG: hypothetical protein Ta2A_22280 [Treponemataceae bacterium]|nr:MAG: hypothetical protein Ta2A_22280 [Treponemataceae bacterium]
MLSLGSNAAFGGMASEQILAAAERALSERVRNMKSSSVHRTKPMYFAAQDDFFNMVIIGDFFAEAAASLEAAAKNLLLFTQKIEADFGRNRAAEIPKGPRTLDIDIVFFGGEKIVIPDLLTIPHPHWRERDFVVKPALEILDKNADGLLWEAFHE